MKSENTNTSSKVYKKIKKELPSKTTPHPQTPQNLNYAKTIFKTPMGSPGSLIGIFPIVLSEFETDIHCELKYKYPIKTISSKQSKVIVKKFKLISQNQKLLIEGYVEKIITICFNTKIKEQDTIITIPFKTIVNITYSVPPKYDTEYTSTKKDCECSECFFSSAEKLFCVHEYTKLTETFEEIGTYCGKEFLTKLVITLGLSILQNQKIFIPEPYEDATVIAEYTALKNIKTSPKTSYVEVGHNDCKGLIARIIKE